ncbi:MAG TPA: hypothetical protein VFT22_19350 [Kofleriaceae bacterium]|nr:hypothetical protein [Kofleriaceae bacterium]
MSRAIQVRVSESVVRTIHVEDGVASPLELLPILPPERMADLLARELEALGFVRDGHTCKRTDPDGIEVTVDLAASTVAVKLGAGAQVAEQVESSTQVAIERREQAESNLRKEAMRELDDRIAARTEELRRAVTAQLEAKIADLKKELDGAIGRATVGALTEKAAQLGRIEETHEDEAGNVTIRVRL